MALGDLVTEDRDKITGQRVLVCLGVGGIVAYLDPEILATIKSLGPAVGCGTGAGAETGEPSPFSQGNPLDTIFGGLFRKCFIAQEYGLLLSNEHFSQFLQNP